MKLPTVAAFAGGTTWPSLAFTQATLVRSGQRTSTSAPWTSIMGVPPWLPLFEMDSAPAGTPVSGMFSVSCSSRRRATTLRDLKCGFAGPPSRSVDWDWAQTWLSPLKSYVQGPGHVFVTPLITLVWARSACSGLYAAASGPPLSRTFVFHVAPASWSTFLKFAPAAAPARVAALGQRESSAPAEVQLGG